MRCRVRFMRLVVSGAYWREHILVNFDNLRFSDKFTTSAVESAWERLLSNRFRRPMAPTFFESPEKEELWMSTRGWSWLVLSSWPA